MLSLKGKSVARLKMKFRTRNDAGGQEETQGTQYRGSGEIGFDAFCFILNFFRIVLRIGPRNPMDPSAFSHSQEPIPEW